jgi:hypothetical protein
MSDEKSSLTAIHDQVAGWLKTFAESPAFALLTESQQSKADAIVDYFADHSFRYLDVAPIEWTRATVRECCLEILPRKVSAEASFFEAIPPVLGSFFCFLGDQALHPQGHVLAKSVETIADDIVSNAKDSDRWGMAKQLVMAAMDAGVNPGDEAALAGFITDYNERLAARYNSVRPATPPMNANPYDPCPCGSGKKFKFCCRELNAERRGFSPPRC